MADIVEMIREVMTLTSNVGALRSDVDNLARKVEDHHDRIIKLEQREELIIEKTKSAAITAVQAMTALLSNNCHFASFNSNIRQNSIIVNIDFFDTALCVCVQFQRPNVDLAIVMPRQNMLPIR